MMDGYLYPPFLPYNYAYPRAGPSKPSASSMFSAAQSPQSQMGHTQVHGGTGSGVKSTHGPLSPAPAQPHPSSSSSSSRRPKMSRKGHSSNPGKQRTVQASLEAKVEKCRGWNALFVPLARGVPSAPPSSPVLGATHVDVGGGGGGGVAHIEHVEHAHAHVPSYGYTHAPNLDAGHISAWQDPRGCGGARARGRAGSVPASIASDYTHCDRSDGSALSRESTRTLVDSDLDVEAFALDKAGMPLALAKHSSAEQWVEDVDEMEVDA